MANYTLGVGPVFVQNSRTKVILISRMPLSAAQLATELNAQLFGDGGASITDVTHDSRQAREGSLFAAIKGETADGHRFIPDVMRRGAAGVISEDDPPEGFTGAWLKVDEVRHSLALAASRVNSDPSHQLDLVGVTGTNGTCAWDDAVPGGNQVA